MEVFRDLYFRADPDKIAAALDTIELPTGWTRDRAAEARVRATAAMPPPIFCFACTKQAGRPASLLILAQKHAETFYVSNVIPIERHQLSYAEYNSVLEDFYQTVLRPCAEQGGLETNMTGADEGLEHWMPVETAEKLRRFSECANKSTGASHPNDKQRWNDFVLSAYREGTKLDAFTLKRWLVEADEWPPDVAEQLAIEYEYGLELLAFAEEGRRSA